MASKLAPSAPRHALAATATAAAVAALGAAFAAACTVEAPVAETPDGPTGTFTPVPGPGGPGETPLPERPDAARTPPRDASVPDATPDAGPAVPAESEPNDGTSETDLDVVTVPGRVTGAIGKADDTDVFGVDLAAGDFWTITVDPAGSPVAPHLGVIQKGDRVPRLVAVGTPGQRTTQDVFVLASERYFVSVRDARNVPAASSQKVGSAAHTYALVAEKKTPTLTTLPVPGTVQGTLASRSGAQLFAMKLVATTGFDLDVRAKRRTPATDLDTRVSLFDAGRKVWIITNDDLSLSQTDSRIGSDALPPGDYVVVVDNVSPTAAQREFEIVTTLR